MKVGITGGMGSGKSLVSEMFRLLGVPVLDTDSIAKYLMENDKGVRDSLIGIFGDAIFDNGRLDRPLLASIVFADPESLQRLNAVVHPATIAYAERWAKEQTAPYTLKESALLFESGSYRSLDAIVGVQAPLETRVQRCMKRDGSDRETVLKRMANQMDEATKMSRCDYVIDNGGQRSVIQQVLDLHARFVHLSEQEAIK